MPHFTSQIGVSRTIAHCSSEQAAHGPATEPLGATEVLFVSPVVQDQATLRRMLSSSQFPTVAAGTCRQALERLAEGCVSVVLCDRELPDGTWCDILSRISGSLAPPLLIVTCGQADERLWAEVLNLGGFDVLAKPFNVLELQHVLKTARAYRHGRIPPLHFASGA